MGVTESVGSPVPAQDTVILFVAEAAVAAQVGGDHIAAHPLSARGAVILLVAE